MHFLDLIKQQENAAPRSRVFFLIYCWRKMALDLRKLPFAYTLSEYATSNLFFVPVYIQRGKSLIDRKIKGFRSVSCIYCYANRHLFEFSFKKKIFCGIIQFLKALSSAKDCI